MTEKVSRINYLDVDLKGKSTSEESFVFGQRAKFLTPPSRDSQSNLISDTFAEDRIMDRLPRYAGNRYAALVPTKIRLEYAEGLSKVMRWKGGLGGQIINPEFEENNLEHVTELIDFMNEIENKYPLLWSEVCDGDREKWMDLMCMIIIHDSGEIAVGDMARSNPDFHKAAGIKHKKKEAIMARRMIRKSVTEHSEKILADYDRFDRREVDDKLVMLGHVLDKMQGSKTYAKNVLPFNAGRTDFDFGKNFISNQNTYLEYADNLAKLISEEARKELLDLLKNLVLSRYAELVVYDREAVEEAQEFIRNKFRNVFGTEVKSKS